VEAAEKAVFGKIWIFFKIWIFWHISAFLANFGFFGFFRLLWDFFLAILENFGLFGNFWIFWKFLDVLET
jgi:hypothetical protein